MHWTNLSRKARELASDTRGNVLMIMGFALVPITFATGMVIDYSRAARLQTKLNAVADASALAATTTPMFKKPMVTACALARNTFINGASDLPGLTLNTGQASNLKIVITETYAAIPDLTFTCPRTAVAPTGLEVQPLSRVAVVIYAGTSDNAFGGILRKDTLDIGGTSTAKVSAAPFVDIHMALDTSQSMGLASSDANAIALWNVTKTKSDAPCTFGCHVPTGNYPKGVPVKSNELLAKENGIELRIDVLRDATVDMIQTAITEQADKRLYRFGLYRIGQNLSTIEALSSDLPAVKNTASTIGLGPNNSNGVGDTNLVSTTDTIFANIPAKGDGKTQLTARAFLFLITDGVADTAGSCTSGHCTAPIDPATCQRYKDAGVTVGVVYTTYLPIKNNPTTSSTALDSRYTSLVQTFSLKDANNAVQRDTQIAPNLRACASNGWYFEASDGPAIHAAIQRLFRQASQTPTITQ